MVAAEVHIVHVRVGERPAGQLLNLRAARQDQAAVKVRPGEARVAQLTYRRVRLKARHVQVGAVGERREADRDDLLVLPQTRVGKVLAPLVRVGGDRRQALHIPQTGGLKAAFHEAGFPQSADFSGLLNGKAGQRGAAGKRLRADRADMHIREADEGELRAGGEGEIAYGIQTVVLEPHRRQARRALAQALGDVGNVILDDEVRDIARGDGVALGVVLVDGLRQIALFIAGVHVPVGHELAERVQDPLLRQLIVGGALSRVVSCIGGVGARFTICGRGSIAAFACTFARTLASRRCGIDRALQQRRTQIASQRGGGPARNRGILACAGGDGRERDHERHGKQHSEKGIANNDALHGRHLSTASPTRGTQGNAYLIL